MTWLFGKNAQNAVKRLKTPGKIHHDRIFKKNEVAKSWQTSGGKLISGITGTWSIYPNKIFNFLIYDLESCWHTKKSLKQLEQKHLKIPSVYKFYYRKKRYLTWYKQVSCLTGNKAIHSEGWKNCGLKTFCSVLPSCFYFWIVKKGFIILIHLLIWDFLDFLPT